MADPFARWLADGSCRKPVIHQFEPAPDADDGRAFRCTRCGLTAGYSVVAAYRIGVEAAGGDGLAVAPSLRFPSGRRFASTGYEGQPKPWQELRRKGWAAR